MDRCQCPAKRIARARLQPWRYRKSGYPRLPRWYSSRSHRADYGPARKLQHLLLHCGVSRYTQGPDYAAHHSHGSAHPRRCGLHHQGFCRNQRKTGSRQIQERQNRQFINRLKVLYLKGCLLRWPFFLYFLTKSLVKKEQLRFSSGKKRQQLSDFLYLFGLIAAFKSKDQIIEHALHNVLIAAGQIIRRIGLQLLLFYKKLNLDRKSTRL